MKRTISLAATGAALALAAFNACYNPDIQDGQLQCAPPNNDCPDGFECRVQVGFAGGTCWKKGSTPGTGGVVGNGGAIGNGGMGGVVTTGGQGGGLAGAGGGVAGMGGGVAGMGGTPGMGGTAGMCIGPAPNCAVSIAPGQACDPVCQQGCDCRERCNISGSDSVCAAPSGNAGPGDTCVLPTDNCLPGLICLPEFDQAKCGQHCYRHCRTDAECLGGAHCTIELVSGDMSLGFRVCDNPPEDCSPVHGRGQCARNDRPYPQFGCYIMGGQFPNQAVCDCAGTAKEDQPCEFERECEPGLICVAGEGNQRALCRRVCPLTSPAQADVLCGVTRRCTPYQGSSRFGFCAPRL